MWPEELVAAVERLWPFTPACYPQLASLDETERSLFSIGHVLRHQSKSLVVLIRVRFNRELVSDKVEELLIKKLIFNSIRFGMLVDGDESWNGFDRFLNWQLPTQDSHSLSDLLSLGAHVYPHLTELSCLTHEASAVIEPYEHGEPVSMDDLKSFVAPFLTSSTAVAQAFGISRADFISWLQKGAPE